MIDRSARRERRRATAAAWPGVAGGILLAVAILASLPARASPERLIEAMRAGGAVVFLRHAATVESQIDTGRLGDRAGQRNLSEAGIAQAEALGRAFDALAIRFAEILASPVHRARDTAEIAFGPERVTVTMDIVADDYAGAELRRMLRATERLLATPPSSPGVNVLLVGHRTPLAMVTGRPFRDDVLPEGAMAVIDPEGEGTRLLGTLDAEALIAAAGQDG